MHNFLARTFKLLCIDLLMYNGWEISECEYCIVLVDFKCIFVFKSPFLTNIFTSISKTLLF